MQVRNPLLAHIDDAQHRALQLQSMLEAIDYLDNEGACDGAKTALINIALEISKEVHAMLDTVNLPKGHADG